MQQAAQRPRILPPRCVEPALIPVVQLLQVHDGIEFAVLELVQQRNGQALRIGGRADRGRTERFARRGVDPAVAPSGGERDDHGQARADRERIVPMMPDQDVPGGGQPLSPGVHILVGQARRDGERPAAMRVHVVEGDRQPQPVRFGDELAQRLPARSRCQRNAVRGRDVAIAGHDGGTAVAGEYTAEPGQVYRAVADRHVDTERQAGPDRGGGRQRAELA